MPLQLYRFNSNYIRAIPKTSSTGSSSVTRRPLTYSKNELATTTFFTIDKLPTVTFGSAREYFRSLTSEHKTHLWTQRNLCDSPVEAHERYASRYLFAQSVDDLGPFKIFYDDFWPQNILVDPTTFRIEAVLNLEFTNSMPSQFASEPPWWLLLVGPDSCLLRGRIIKEFVEGYAQSLYIIRYYSGKPIAPVAHHWDQRVDSGADKPRPQNHALGIRQSDISNPTSCRPRRNSDNELCPSSWAATIGLGRKRHMRMKADLMCRIVYCSIPNAMPRVPRSSRTSRRYTRL